MVVDGECNATGGEDVRQRLEVEMEDGEGGREDDEQAGWWVGRKKGEAASPRKSNHITNIPFWER